MSIVMWKFIVCIAAAVVIGVIGGYIFGKNSIKAPVPAGIIDFEPTEEGGLRCIFKLEGDVEWIANQKTIIFEVHGPRDSGN